MRRYFYYLSLLLFIIVGIESCGIKARIKRADKRMSMGEYYSAGEIYKKTYGRIPSKDKNTRAYVAFRQGECFRTINNYRAEMAYANAIRNKYNDSIVFLRYAQSLHSNGKYGEAAKFYKLYLQHDSANDIAKNGLIAIDQINSWKSNPARFAVKKVTELNARRSSSFSPAFISPATDVITFTSTREFNKKIIQKNSQITGIPTNKLFSMRRNNAGKWEKPILVDGEINNLTDDNGANCFSPDGKVMYFTRARKSETSALGAQIYYSVRAGGTWGAPQPLKVLADSSVSVAHPALAPDGETFYFVSDAKNGLGGKDIWRGKLESGAVKYIENLGPQINTSGDEMFPTVRADGVLYFSSNGRPGLGGLDIFKATPKKDGSWTVENAGVPLNSQGDDFGISFAGKSESGFFSSNRDDRKGLDAIWSFDLPDLVYALEGKVVDDKGNPVSDAIVKMVGNDGTNARIATKKDGTFRLKLNKDVNYELLATGRGYLNQEKKLSTQGVTDSKTFRQDFTLSTIYKPVQLENIFYEFAKWDLTPASETGLQVLVKILNDNPHITIELSSHTDYVGNNESNMTLSEKRAQSVVNYLISHGINKDRLTAVGYGETRPFVVDEATARKFPFLKPGDELTEDFILKLKPEQQEQANQINRRTEFGVLKTTYKMY